MDIKTFCTYAIQIVVFHIKPVQHRMIPFTSLSIVRDSIVKIEHIFNFNITSHFLFWLCLKHIKLEYV